MMSCLQCLIVVGESEVARRLVELSTQKEDLQYQLSCCQGQLEIQTQRAEGAEVTHITIVTVTMVAQLCVYR